MRIAMACDHAGRPLKDEIATWLRTEWLGAQDEKYARRVGKVQEIDARHRAS